jgi:NADPH:quinone reductase-like Zn-dependent oxidoreductase
VPAVTARAAFVNSPRSRACGSEVSLMTADAARPATLPCALAEAAGGDVETMDMNGPKVKGEDSEAHQGTAYWATAPGEGELRGDHWYRNPMTSSTGEEVLVRTLYSGVSRGTEALVHHGRVPRSEHDRMRAPFQMGEFPFPVKYGYMAVGRVEDGPGDLVGKTVFCLHPHQDLFRVPVEAVTVVPEGIPAERATLAANMETAINILWDGRPCLGDRITVIGAGVLGSLVSYLAAQIPGADVTLVDVLASRATVAEALGVSFFQAEPRPGPATVDESLLGSDLVIHTSGSPRGLASALVAAGPEARIVEASWYGDREVNVALGAEFHSQRLELRSSQVGQIPPHQARRWTHRRRLELALRLLADDRLDVLISSVDPFEEIVHRLPARLAENETLCAVFSYRA